MSEHDEVSTISERLKARMIDAYAVVSATRVVFTESQRSTILSAIQSSFMDAFGENIPGAPDLEPL